MRKHLLSLLILSFLHLSFMNTIHAENRSFASRDAYPFTRIAEAKRFYALIKEIRCVVCQNQTIADSNAPLANDLREKVYKMVIEKKSTADIKDYLVKRYGEFILLQPRLNKLTFLLWAFPFIGLACIFPLILRLRL